MTNNQKFHSDQPTEIQKSEESLKENNEGTYDLDLVDIPNLVKKSLSQYQPAAHRIMAFKEKILNR